MGRNRAMLTSRASGICGRSSLKWPTILRRMMRARIASHGVMTLAISGLRAAAWLVFSIGGQEYHNLGYHKFE